MKITVPHRVAGVATAALCAAAFAACGSSSGPSANSTTTVPSTTIPATTVPSTTTANATEQANTVCTDIQSAVSALKSVNLGSANSIQSHTNALASDMSNLNSAVSNYSAAPAGSPIQKMDADVKTAISQGEAAASQISKGNAGNAKTDFQNMMTDLNNGRAAGAKANLSNCS